MGGDDTFDLDDDEFSAAAADTDTVFGGAGDDVFMTNGGSGTQSIVLLGDEGTDTLIIGTDTVLADTGALTFTGELVGFENILIHDDGENFHDFSAVGNGPN